MEPKVEVCSQLVLLKDDGEFTTKQQEVLLEKYKVKCSTRPLRTGRAKEYPEQDTSEWRELTCHGDPDYIKAALKEALQLCEVTRLAKEKETPDEKRRLEATNDKISDMITEKEARKEANIKAHKERMQQEHDEALKRRTAQAQQKAWFEAWHNIVHGGASNTSAGNLR